jgi:uncharacterized membrane protein
MLVQAKGPKPLPASKEDNPMISRGNGTEAVRSKVTAAGAASIEAVVPKERVSAVFDGIIAIAATLLIMSVDISSTDKVLTFGDFARAAHQILNWLVSFLMVAVIWGQFHFIFSHSKHWDMGLMALTFLQVAAVSLIPFASNVAGDHPESVAAAIVFTGVMAANGYILALNAWLLLRKTHLHVDDSSYHHLQARIHAQAAMYSITTCIAMAGTIFHHPLWGILTWLVCPMLLFLLLNPSARRF